MDTLIKNINEENWHFLKVEAAKERVTMGELFNRVIEEYKNMGKDNDAKTWEKIFRGKPILSKKETKSMHMAIKSFRKELDFE